MQFIYFYFTVIPTTTTSKFVFLLFIICIEPSKTIFMFLNMWHS